MPDTIRRMALADIDAVLEIEQNAFAMPWSRRAFEYELTENHCARYLVADAAGTVAGYVGAHMILDEGHITNVAVDAAFRRRGIGRGLMLALMQYAANLGVDYMTLEVRKGNLAAQALYTSLGFVRVALRKKYYEDNGEDAFLMACDTLPPAQADFSEAETTAEP
jgi:[ribosomal protein S18]-alanine N-acetyltransferase